MVKQILPYLPLLERIKDERELLKGVAQWLYYYNVEWLGIDGMSPWQKLRELGMKVPTLDPVVTIKM